MICKVAARPVVTWLGVGLGHKEEFQFTSSRNASTQ